MRSLWPKGGLWRHGDFLKLWSAETISQFGSQIDDLAFPLVAILVLDASAFEVAVLGTVLFLPFILFTLPAGVWVDRLPAASGAHRRRLRSRGSLRDGSDRLRRGRPHALAALRRRLPRRRLPGLLRRRLPVVPPLARRSRPDHRGELEVRDQPLGRPDLRAGPRRDPRRDPDGAVRRPRRRAQLRRVRPLHPPDPQAGGAPRARHLRRRNEDELLGTSSRRAWASSSATPTCAPRPGAPGPRTSSSASASRSTSCSPCASSGSRPA